MRHFVLFVYCTAFSHRNEVYIHIQQSSWLSTSPHNSPEFPALCSINCVHVRLHQVLNHLSSSLPPSLLLTPTFSPPYSRFLSSQLLPSLLLTFSLLTPQLLSSQLLPSLHLTPTFSPPYSLLLRSLQHTSLGPHSAGSRMDLHHYFPLQCPHYSRQCHYRSAFYLLVPRNDHETLDIFISYLHHITEE